MNLHGTGFPDIPSQDITVASVDYVCTNVVRLSSEKVTCTYPVRGPVGCTKATVTLKFNGVQAASDGSSSSRICYVDSFKESETTTKTRWETNWAFNIILMVAGGVVALGLCWYGTRCVVKCCCDCCCGSKKYVPPASGTSRDGPSTKVTPTLHRLATCEDTLSELKLAKAAWSMPTPPPPQPDPPPPKIDTSEIDQKLWSLTQ